MTRRARTDAARKHIRAPRLSTAFIGAATIFGLIAVLVIWGPIERQARSFQREVQVDNAMRGARALELALSRALEREWDSLSAVAGNADATNLNELRNFADAVLRAGGRIAWAGFADRSGIIRAGAGRTREGEDVGTRRWFREGLDGGSIGNVYKPSSQRAGSDEESESLVNMSMPVRDAEGEILGVFVYSLRIAWLAEYLRSAAEKLELDAFVLDRDNEVIAERNAVIDAPLSPGAISLLRLNQPHSEIVSNGSGPERVFAVIPSLGAETMPALRWTLLVRLPAIDAGVTSHSLTRAIMGSLLSLFFVLVVFVVVFTRHFLRPIEKLAAISRQVADGEDVYPEEFDSTRESANFSHSLSLLQTRLR